MREIFLCKYGEIALKGANRASFEALLVRELKFRLGHVGKFNIIRSQSVIRVEPTEEMTSEQLDTAYTLLRRTFGIVAVSRVAETEKDFDAIAALAVEYLGERLANARTFKVETKRADKRFPMTSDAVSRELGGKILSTSRLTSTIRRCSLSARSARAPRTSARVRSRARAVCP